MHIMRGDFLIKKLGINEEEILNKIEKGIKG